MAKKKAARELDTSLPPSCGILKKLPLRARVALGLRLAELALAPMPAGFRKRYRVEESLAMARKIVQGKRFSERDRKAIVDLPDRWFDEYGDSTWRGETYGLLEVTCAMSLLAEIDDGRGRSISSVIDGAAYLMTRQWTKNWWEFDADDLDSVRYLKLMHEVLKACEHVIYQAAWRAYEIVSTVKEQDLSLSTLAGIEIVEPPPPENLSWKKSRKASRG